MRTLSIRDGEKGRKGGEERTVRLPGPASSFPVTVCIRPASELPVRIESAESPVEANCQLLRRCQPGAYCATELEIPWHGSLEPSTARDRTIGFTLACIYISIYICRSRAIYRDAGFASRDRRGVRYALTCQKFNQFPEIPYADLLHVILKSRRLLAGKYHLYWSRCYRECLKLHCFIEASISREIRFCKV